VVVDIAQPLAEREPLAGNAVQDTCSASVLASNSVIVRPGLPDRPFIPVTRRTRTEAHLHRDHHSANEPSSCRHTGGRQRCPTRIRPTHRRLVDPYSPAPGRR